MYDYKYYADLWTFRSLENNIMDQNLNTIKKELTKHGMTVERVCYHTLFDEKYYLIKLRNCFGSLNKIADALCIPTKYVTFGSITKNISVYYMKQKEFDELHMGSDGRILFRKYPNLYEAYTCLDSDYIKKYFSFLLNISCMKINVDYSLECVEICMRNTNDIRKFKGRFHPCKYDDYIVLIKKEELEDYDFE